MASVEIETRALLLQASIEVTARRAPAAGGGRDYSVERAEARVPVAQLWPGPTHPLSSIPPHARPPGSQSNQPSGPRGRVLTPELIPALASGGPDGIQARMGTPDPRRLQAKGRQLVSAYARNVGQKGVTIG